MDANSNVPAFIVKLWKLVEDCAYDHLICWNANGRSFTIQNQSRFAKELLPLYFKHNNMASFIRQLNMYGFRKVVNIENSGLRAERDDIEFFHQFFVRGEEKLLENIKRKVSAGKIGSHLNALKSDDIGDILSDMENMRGKQETVDNLLSNMQRENEALWREVAILRQKHHKQQQIVEKLIQFLVSFVQNHGVLHGVKRKAQLMIDSANRNINSKAKSLKTNACDFGSGDTKGPIIHDVTNDIEDDLNGVCDSPIITTSLSELSPKPQVSTESSTLMTDNLLANAAEPSQAETLNMLDPLSATIQELGIVAENTGAESDSNVDNLSVDNLLRTTLNTPPGTPILKSSFLDDTDLKNSNSTNEIKDLVISGPNDQSMSPTSYTNSLTDHVDGIEAELDWLQDQLAGGGLNIDTSALFGLFALDDPLLSMPSNAAIKSSEIIGNEVVQFNTPSFNSNALFDDIDLDNILPENTEEIKDEEVSQVFDNSVQ